MATAAGTLDLSPDEVEDQSIQQAGDEGATYAPAPLQAATNDLDVKYVKPDTSDPNVQRQNTVEGGNAIAGVQQGEPRQVEVDDPDKFKANAQQVAPHELYHLWAGNLTPSVAARIPTSTSMDDYKQPTADDLNAMRAKGMTLLDVPSEKGAQMMAWAALHPEDKQYQKALSPYLDDMRKTSPSVIIPTSPNDKTINTTPRAPGAPADNIPGMEAFYHHITPGGGKLISRATAQQYMDKANGNPAVARIMAAHDGHQSSPAALPRSQTMAVPNPKGLVEPGNIPIWNRPSVKNFDGSHSSELSMSFTDDKGHEVLVPTVVNGKFLTPNGQIPRTYKDPNSPEMKALGKAAWANYEKTGQHLGKFDNPDHADAYAYQLHSRGQQKGRQ